MVDDDDSKGMEPPLFDGIDYAFNVTFFLFVKGFIHEEHGRF